MIRRRPGAVAGNGNLFPSEPLADAQRRLQPGPQMMPSVLGKPMLGCCDGVRGPWLQHPPVAALRSELVLHPLTSWERRAVAERIRREVTETAADLLRTEQDTKVRLNSVHIKCISLLVTATVAVGFGMVYLRVVLVPFVLATFFMFLIEPFLLAILNPPTLLKRCHRRFRRLADKTEHSRISSSKPLLQQLRDAEIGCSSHCNVVVGSVGWRVWSLFAVALCILVLLGTGGFVVYFIVQAIGSFPWDKYASSEKLRLVLNIFPIFGSDPKDLKVERFIAWLLEGPLFNALDVTFSILSQGFLTVLFLAFLLTHAAEFGESEDLESISRKIRVSVRRYIRIKTLMAVVVACAVGFIYWHSQVDLAFLFAFLTFLLCYVPQVGNTVAVLVPLPLVFLDPSKTLADLFFVFVVPFMIHQLAANLVEPKLLATSLELHPVIVLLALVFWTTIWGPVGAILSVPLTAVVRLVLMEVDHPYTQPIVKILEGEMRELHIGPLGKVGDLLPSTTLPRLDLAATQGSNCMGERGEPTFHAVRDRTACEVTACTSPVVWQPVGEEHPAGMGEMGDMAKREQASGGAEQAEPRTKGRDRLLEI